MAMLATPDYEINTAMVLSNAMYEIARKINDVLTITGMDKFGWTELLFYLACFAAVLHFFYELSKVVRSGFMDGGNLIDAIFQNHVVQKTIRFFVFLLLAIGSWNLYRAGPGDALYFTWGHLNTAATATDVAFDDLGGGVFTQSGTNGAPTAAPAGDFLQQLWNVRTTIASASNSLGAWHIANQVRIEILKEGARDAGITVLKNNNFDENTESITGDLPTGDNEAVTQASSSIFTQVISKLTEMMSNFIGDCAVVGTAGVLTLANFGLDIMIVRVIWFNAIYLLIAYKACVLFLPIVLILAYWPSMTSFLIGVVRQIVICIITVHVLSSATATILTQDRIKEWALEAARSSQASVAASMASYAEKTFGDMIQANPNGFSAKSYLSKLDDQLSNPMNGYFVSLEVSFYAPLRVFMILAIVIALLGKMVVVVSDTLSGSMTFHRG